MWVIFTFNVVSPDTAVYRWIYNDFEDIPNAFEPLFSMLILICKTLGGSYTFFRGMIAALVLIFISKTYKKFSNYRNFAIALYMIEPFVWYISGLRAGLSCAILVYAFSFLIVDNSKSKMKFSIWVLIATMVHYSSVLFMIMLFADKKIDKRRVFIYGLLATVGILIFSYSSILLDIMSSVTDREKILTWLSVGREGYPNLKGFLAELIVLFGNIILVKFSRRQIVLRHDLDTIDDDQKLANTICNINYLSILFIPFLRLNDNYMRLIYVIHAVNIILYSLVSSRIRQRRADISYRTTVCSYDAVVIMWTVIIAIYQNLPYMGMKNSIINTINGNSIFGLK